MHANMLVLYTVIDRKWKPLGKGAVMREPERVNPRGVVERIDIRKQLV